MYAQTIPSALPMYPNNKPQIHRLHWCTGAVDTFKAAFPMNALPPFLTKTAAGNVPSTVLLVPVEKENEQLDMTGLVPLVTAIDGVNKWISHTAATTIAASTEVAPGDYTVEPPTGVGDDTYGNWIERYQKGGFYLMLKLTPTVWHYTPIFFIEDITTGDPSTECNHVRLQWDNGATDPCALGDLRYDLADFTIVNRLYLPSEAIRPDYEYDDDGQEDDDNEAWPHWQKAKKRSVVEILAPEWVADALHLLPLHARITFIDQYGDTYTLEGRNAEVDISWDGPCLARIRIILFDEYFVASCCA